MNAGRQVTFASHGHVLTNAAVWSCDGRRLVYDVRSDAAGSCFDGDRVETIDVDTGEVHVLYQARRGAKCGVAAFDPGEDRVAFILGPEDPTPEWSYGPARRRGVIVREDTHGVAVNLDARDLMPPFTPGALRGGSHVHMFSPNGRVSFTYEDHVLDQAAESAEPNQRNVAVGFRRPVTVPRGHARNHDGEYFCVVATRTTAQPRPVTDEIGRAFEEAWIGQTNSLAFQGLVADGRGGLAAELFVVDLPRDWTRPSGGPLEGTTTQRPRPPLGTAQRRLTRTMDRPFPGLQGPRHWPRSSPDGSQVAFLMRDDAGVVQLWLIAPSGGGLIQLTHNKHDIASAFTWSPEGKWIAHAMDGSICATDVGGGRTRRLTMTGDGEMRPEACVYSPDGSRIAFVRHVGGWNQIFICEHESTKE